MLTKVGRLKKASLNVRNSLNRQIERAEAANNVTESEAIKNHRRETALANYCKCFQCLSNYTESGSIIVNEEDDEFSHLKEKPELRRMAKFSMCVNCSRSLNNGAEAEAPVQDCSNLMCVKSTDRGNIYFLKTEDNEESTEEESASSLCEEASDANEDELDKDSKTVMFPTNTGCLIPDNEHIKYKVASLVPVIINKCEEVTVDDVGVLYCNQISKYRNIKNFSTRFCGDIGDIENKTLSNIKELLDDSQIRGSDKWYEHQTSNISQFFVEFGQSAFRVEIKVPLKNTESIATNLLIDGFCLTVSFEGGESNDEDTKYVVHLSHTAASLCPDDCEKIPLGDYLETRPTEFGSGRFISSYLTSASQKMQSLVKNIIRCPSSRLCSEEYFFTIKFDSQGVGYIEGYIWPDASLEYNKHQSWFSFFGGSQDRAAYLDFVDKGLTCTSSEEELCRLGLNKKEACRVIALVERYQIKSGDRELPSLMIMYTHSPDHRSMGNIQEAKKLRAEMKVALQNLTEEELKELTTDEWLQEISTWRVEIEDNGNNDSLQFQFNYKEFSFILDQVLLEMIVKFDNSFIGAYHYSVGCEEDEDDTNTIILKRGHLRDCITSVYNPFILLAMRAPTVVSPVLGVTRPRLSKCDKFLSEDGIPPNIVATHQQISLTEAYSLSDPRKFRELSSSPVIYCNTNPDAKTTFIKVREPTEQSFTADEINGHFEISYNVVKRHKCRMNGEGLLLSETASMYSYVGEAESKKLFPVYCDHLDKIPQSETESISKSRLPDLILCSNKDVLKKRKRKAVINFPSFESGSVKFKYSKILLFYPLAPDSEVSENDVERLFYETNINQPLDKYNMRLTVIENNERMFYQRSLKRD